DANDNVKGLPDLQLFGVNCPFHDGLANTLKNNCKLNVQQVLEGHCGEGGGPNWKTVVVGSWAPGCGALRVVPMQDPRWRAAGAGHYCLHGSGLDPRPGRHGFRVVVFLPARLLVVLPSIPFGSLLFPFAVLGVWQWLLARFIVVPCRDRHDRCLWREEGRRQCKGKSDGLFHFGDLRSGKNKEFICSLDLRFEVRSQSLTSYEKTDLFDLHSCGFSELAMDYGRGEGAKGLSGEANQKLVAVEGAGREFTQRAASESDGPEESKTNVAAGVAGRPRPKLESKTDGGCYWHLQHSMTRSPPSKLNQLEENGRRRLMSRSRRLEPLFSSLSAATSLPIPRTQLTIEKLYGRFSISFQLQPLYVLYAINIQKMLPPLCMCVCAAWEKDEEQANVYCAYESCIELDEVHTVKSIALGGTEQVEIKICQIGQNEKELIAPQRKKKNKRRRRPTVAQFNVASTATQLLRSRALLIFPVDNVIYSAPYCEGSPVLTAVFNCNVRFVGSLIVIPPNANNIRRQGVCVKGKSVGRPRVSEENVQRVRDAFVRSPKKSVRKARSELAMPVMTVWKVLRNMNLHIGITLYENG
ncbi:hypothetical protein C0J52_20210, partial [Blattella germanica]